MNKILVLSFAVAMVLSATVIMAAGENKQISLQGRLTDATGKPLSGTYSFAFTLFGVAEGGTALGSPSWSETQTITVSKGLFSTRIGKTAFPPELKFDMPYYVEIAVNDETLSPRYILAASPYVIATPVIPTTFSANAITSDVLALARIPALTIDKIPSIPTTKLTGTIADSQIAAVAASKITGSIADFQIASVSGSKITGNVNSLVTALDASKITSGCFTATRIPSLPSSWTGTIDGSRISGTEKIPVTAIPSLPASKLPALSFLTGQLDINTQTSGFLPATRLSGLTEGVIPALTSSWGGTVYAGKITGLLDMARIPPLPSSWTGTVDGSRISGTGSIPSAAIPALTAAKVPYLDYINGKLSVSKLATKYKAGTYGYPCGAYDSKTVQVSTTDLSGAASCACSVTATAASSGTPPKNWDYICNCAATANADGTHTDITIWPRYVSRDGTAPCSGTAFTLTIDWVAIER